MSKKTETKQGEKDEKKRQAIKKPNRKKGKDNKKPEYKKGE
jgi:hypothetical protein